MTKKEYVLWETYNTFRGDQFADRPTEGQEFTITTIPGDRHGPFGWILTISTLLLLVVLRRDPFSDNDSRVIGYVSTCGPIGKLASVRCNWEYDTKTRRSALTKALRAAVDAVLKERGVI
ncbi:MAG: hypothetical protein V2A58_15100 [Planctomycetota bacterium]